MDDIFNPKTAFNGDTFLLCYDHASSDQDQYSAPKPIYKCANATSRCYQCSNTPLILISVLSTCSFLAHIRSSAFC
ncbi:hypothetical protein Hanom_Chr08g00705371 [Helianthus anomalus]